MQRKWQPCNDCYTINQSLYVCVCIFSFPLSLYTSIYNVDEPLLRSHAKMSRVHEIKSSSSWTWLIFTHITSDFSHMTSFFSSAEYGRTCRDIGCLPREVCVMAYDTCSFSQQEGTNCGRFPKCQARVDTPPQPQQNSGEARWGENLYTD